MLTGKVLGVLIEPLGVEGCAAGRRLVRPTVVCKQKNMSHIDQANTKSKRVRN